MLDGVQSKQRIAQNPSTVSNSGRFHICTIPRTGEMLIEHRRSESLVQEAEAKFRAGFYDDALDLLDGCEDWVAPVNEEAVCLKAQILGRRNPLVSLQELANSQDIFVTPQGMFNYYLAIGRGYAATRNFEAAESMYRKARKLLTSLDQSQNLLSQVALQEARLRWMKGEFDPESVELIHALQDTAPQGKMNALLVRAWMHAGLERYDLQLADFAAALHIAGEYEGQCDAYTIGVILYGILRIAMETGNEAAMSAGKAAFDRMTWTPDLQTEHFQSVRALGFHAFLSGEAIRAQRYFKESQALATSQPWEVTAHLDRAHVASINKNDLWAMEETLEAERLARDVAWVTTQGEERMALVTLGVLFAKIDMAKAQHYIALFNQMGTSNVAPSLALARDRRALALERFASGRVQQVLGNEELATTLLQEAYAIFDQVGYRYRAALTALALHELTGDAAWQRRSQENAAIYPRSPVNETIENAPDEPADEIFMSLTPSQKQVFAAICEGLSVAEMAERFNRSIFTINKHIQAVYNSYDVHSRNELRAEAKQRKLFGQVWASSLDTYLKVVKS